MKRGNLGSSTTTIMTIILKTRMSSSKHSVHATRSMMTFYLITMITDETIISCVLADDLNGK